MTDMYNNNNIDNEFTERAIYDRTARMCVFVVVSINSHCRMAQSTLVARTRNQST